MRYNKGIVAPPGIPLVRGSSLHKTNEVNLKQKQLTEKDMPLSDMQDCTRDAFHKKLSDGILVTKEEKPSKKRLLNDALNQSIQLTSLYKNQIAPIINDPTEVEQPFTVYMPGLDIPLHGRPDCKTTKAIRDLKVTGKVLPAEQIKREIQPSFYSLVDFLETGQQEHAFVFDNLVAVKKPYVDHPSMIIGPRQHDIVKRKIMAFVAMVKSGVYPPPPPTAWVCTPKYCGYHGMCNYTK